MRDRLADDKIALGSQTSFGAKRKKTLKVNFNRKNQGGNVCSSIWHSSCFLW